MKKLLFIYDLENEELWKDGLWAAIELLKKDFKVEKWNIAKPAPNKDLSDVDFVLGWGAFGSPVDKVLKNFPMQKGLCLGGYSPLQENVEYSIIFYETEWSKKWLEQFCDVPMKHAFGTNTDIYKKMNIADENKLWDYLTVGSFSLWKRQENLTLKEGHKMAVGQIQRSNLSESIDIIGNLLLGHCGVSDMVSPEELAKMYNLSRKVYIPAEVMGGGERAVLEARACGIPVEVEKDNPKLQELLTSPIWDQYYYASQLKGGINECLNEN